MSFCKTCWLVVGLLVAGVAWVSTTPTQSQPPPQRSEKWKYKILHGTIDDNGYLRPKAGFKGLPGSGTEEEALNEMGADGWELCSIKPAVTRMEKAPGGGEYPKVVSPTAFYFKRLTRK